MPRQAALALLVAHVLVPLLLLSDTAVAQDDGRSGGPCPNGCTSHGLCILTECHCFDGWSGGDCSRRNCPKGAAWSDAATAEDTAHGLTECSDRGRCDTKTGTCQCDASFSGRACQFSKCPNSCNNRGRCLDMRYNALYKDPGVGPVYTYDSVWDAEKIYGCQCDQGFTGYDCSLRECPAGDDPMTESQDDEIQLMSCKASGGAFSLTLRGHTTEAIPVTTTQIEFTNILQQTPGFGEVEVAFSESGSAVCGASVDQVVSIKFLEIFGNVEDLVSHSTSISSCADPSASSYNLCGGAGMIFAFDGDSLAPTTGSAIFSVQGSKEMDFCSRRGYCDLVSGVCTCYTNFVTSDGRGNEGDRGDCGYASTEIQACPGIIACSGHGTCSQSPSFRCSCSLGWASGDCSVRTCPQGKSWFDLPIADNRAHQLAACSDMGVCDQITGECRCRPGFAGAACDQMNCPGTASACSGHGQCLSMAQLANKATDNGDLAFTTYGAVPNDPLRWDHDMIKGCLCDSGYAGHDCALQTCPYGDDPETDGQVHEMQALLCTADAGTLKLNFRQRTSASIAFDATAATVRAALSALSSITDVEVVFSSGSALCTAGGTNVATITFTQELGNVPPLRAFTTEHGASLGLAAGAGTVAVATDGGSVGGVTAVEGTMENIECSGRGTCDRDTGACKCFSGFGSSDGSARAGDRGDCGWKIPWSVSLASDAAEFA